jgi:TrmH family RNA methyltransferase
MTLVEGPNVVRDALDSGATLYEALYTETAAADPAVGSLVDALREHGVDVELVADAQLAEFADTVTPQGLLVTAGIPRRTLDEVSSSRLTVLDAVQDPGNVGTLIRAAEALGAGAVVLLPGTADAWSPKVVRAAAGASFRIPIVETTAAELGNWCRDHGVPLLATAVGGEPAPRTAGPRDAALVLGNEAAGVSDAVLAAADGVVGVPQRGRTDSLNVAMAGAILMDRLFGG